MAYDVLEDTPDLVLAEIEKNSQLSAMPGLPEEPGVPQSRTIRDTEIANTEAMPAAEGDESAAGLVTADAAVELPPAVDANGLSADELYSRGLASLREKNRAQAYEWFLAAHRSGEQLDEHKTQQLAQFLRQLQPKTNSVRLAAAQVSDADLAQAEAGSPALEEASQRKQVALEKLRTEVLNAVFKAEKLSSSDPTAARTLLDQALASIENSTASAGLDQQALAPLVRSITRTREQVDAQEKVLGPKLAEQKRNEDVINTIKVEQKTKLRIEQEFAEKVEKFNELMDQKRYADAEVIAKQAKQLAPENPVAEVMVFKSLFARRNQINNDIRDRREKGAWDVLTSVEEALIPFDGEIEYPDAKKWKDLTAKRKGRYRTDVRTRSEQELRIEKSLTREVSLHFENTPINEVVKHLMTLADVNIHIDKAGLEEEGVETSTPVTIDVDGIQLKSALNLMLEPLRLGYTIRNDVLQITSQIKRAGELTPVTYPVQDLVIPIPNFVPSGEVGMQSSGSANSGTSTSGFPGQLSVSVGSPQKSAGTAFAAIDDRPERQRDNFSPFGSSGQDGQMKGGGAQADFTALIQLITQTVAPDSWQEVGGAGTIQPFNTTLSLVVRQTQQVHDEIADLLEQLRRLQDLQVTIEVRFVTVSDRFFERIGIDFDFNVQDTVGDGSLPPTFGQPQAPFGTGVSVGVTGTTATTGTTGGTQGATAGGGGSGGFQQGPQRDHPFAEGNRC